MVVRHTCLPNPCTSSSSRFHWVYQPESRPSCGTRRLRVKDVDRTNILRTVLVLENKHPEIPTGGVPHTKLLPQPHCNVRGKSETTQRPVERPDGKTTDDKISVYPTSIVVEYSNLIVPESSPSGEDPYTDRGRGLTSSKTPRSSRPEDTSDSLHGVPLLFCEGLLWSQR